MSKININTALKRLAAAAPVFQTSKATKKAQDNLTGVVNQWNTAIGDNLKKYNEMGNFDPQKSAYYKSAYNTLKQIFQNRGKADMQNAVAAAAANTGGYGNSYGATAGNRAYQNQLNALAAKVPNLYSAASGEFANQKNNLASLIGMQQSQMGLDVNNAQFAVNAQQALDELRYSSDVNRDSAERERMKTYLSTL